MISNLLSVTMLIYADPKPYKEQVVQDKFHPSWLGTFPIPMSQIS